MNRMIPLMTAIFLLFSGSVVSLSVGAQANTDAAVSSVQGYMGALIAGDVVEMQTYLAPSLLAKRKRLLDNPTYAQRLQEAYGNASYEVVGSELIAGNKVQVDVRILLNQQDVVHSRFILMKTANEYRIFAEN